MGSKKNKIKKVLAPTSPPTSDANAISDNNANANANNDGSDEQQQQHLMDDLLSELDSRDPSVRRESAVVLEEVRTRQAAEAAPPDKAAGGNSKARFKARQVRLRFATPALATVTSLSLRQGKPQRLLDSSRPSIPTPMRSSSGRPRRRNVRSTGCATS
jgi:hypothetical protein